MLKLAVLFVGAVHAADLSLFGDGSNINFVSTDASANAKLAVSCSNDKPAFKWLSPAAVHIMGSVPDTKTVRARVVGIPTNCEAASFDTMCYSDDPDYPPMVWCKWEGDVNVTKGPIRLSYVRCRRCKPAA
jgi:hypothetical protein